MVRNTLAEETRRLDLAGLLIAIGHAPRSELFTEQLDLNGEGYLKDASSHQRASDRPMRPVSAP
ncbi:hypothetical protein ACIA98_31910 [Streptomyces sp. NPDC051366]|uniref:hypothetical protein n=1 Tax=Streptomyces sp. NPDC051366 TaxID=3365652 RepID=UPI000AA88E5C